jgi:hypothetical protein
MGTEGSSLCSKVAWHDINHSPSSSNRSLWESANVTPLRSPRLMAVLYLSKHRWPKHHYSYTESYYHHKRTKKEWMNITIQMHIWKKSCTISCLNAWLLIQKLHNSWHYTHGLELTFTTLYLNWEGKLFSVEKLHDSSTWNQHKVDNTIPTPKIQSIRFTKCHYRHYLNWTTITQITEISKSNYFAFIKSRSKTQFWHLLERKWKKLFYNLTCIINKTEQNVAHQKK